MNENSLSVLESKILEKMYGLRKGVIIQGNEEYENRELKELYRNPNIVQDIKLRRRLNEQDNYDETKGSENGTGKCIIRQKIACKDKIL